MILLTAHSKEEGKAALFPTALPPGSAVPFQPTHPHTTLNSHKNANRWCPRFRNEDCKLRLRGAL